MTTLNEMLEKLPPQQRAAVEKRASELIAQQTTLQDLHKARQLTQQHIGQLLGTSQDSVSHLEERSDLLLSTLRSYIEAMGGHLRLIVEFPDRPPVEISSLLASQTEDSSSNSNPS